MFNPKIILARQADIVKFKNVKRQLYNCNANIYSTRKCLRRNLTPKYVKRRAYTYSGL